MAEIFEDSQYLISRGDTFDELRNDQKHSDVVIVTSDGTKFSCHKIILIAGSPFFRRLFATDMVDNCQNEVQLNPIDISGYLFKLLLEFIYTGKIKLNFEDAKAINIYAKLFKMTNLKNMTEICLIKNITNKTCLMLWRHSEKYFSDKLKESCLSLAANSEVFLDTHVGKLTIEEIKSIVSLKKLNSEILRRTILKWIKIDFEDRQQYIKDLMELIDFDNIKDEELEEQIFSDEILMESKEFLKLHIKYLSKKVLKNAVNVPKKTLFVVTQNKIFKTKFYTKEFVVTKLHPEVENFTTSCHTKNGFVTTGGCKNGVVVNLCTQFIPSKDEKTGFPSLIKGRYFHRNYTVGSKIYACGGVCTNTVEIFEGNAGKWISGPAMNAARYTFGAADDSENSLYAIGGQTWGGVLPSIERLDTRMKSWQTIYLHRSVPLGYMQSLYQDDKIYCFQDRQVFIFDVRANKNLDTIQYNLNDSYFMLGEDEDTFDCTIVDNNIWAIGKARVNNKGKLPDAFRLGLQTDRWGYQKITWEKKNFTGLDESENLSLVWCRNN